MSKVRVYEVARQLGMKNKELVALFQSLGFNEVRNHMSAVEADVVERVKRKLDRDSKPAVVEERIRAGVVKRRSRGRAKPEASAESSDTASATPPVRRRRVAPAADEAKPKAEEAPKPAKAKAEEAPKKEEAEAKAPAPAEAKSEEKPAEAKSEDKPAEAKPEAKPAEAKPVEAKAEDKPAEKKEPAKEAAPAKAAEPDKPAATPAKTTGERPTRRTAPPKRGIEVWAGRPGVPMPQRPRTGPRRTTYDPRANKGGNQRFGGGFRGGMRRGMRPGFRGRPGSYGRGPRRGPAEVSTKDMSEAKKVIKIEGETRLQKLAQGMSVKATDVLMRLLSMGMTGVHINSTLDADTAKLVADEFGWRVENVELDEELELLAAMEMDGEATSEAEARAPVVTVMGHVDHGKTTLLDRIRRADVAGGEAGGITQHIGAYRVQTDKGTICFLDTPGHEAFSAMRQRGANATDIVVLVVAADDGVMPQTKEVIKQANIAKVPIIVAANKIDKPGSDFDALYRDLATEGLQAEDWGGDTIVCKVSAKTGEGVDHLLDMLVLQAEMMELKAPSEARAQGIVVEALLDRGRGPVARVLVQSGTLRRGDVLLAGPAYGKIRAMVDDRGKQIQEAGPSTPVEVLGLNSVPGAGDPVHAVKNLRAAETLAEERRKRVTKKGMRPDATVSMEALLQGLAQPDQYELKVVLKADVQGSAEALEQALNNLSTDRVKLVMVQTGVGAISETDVNLAAAAKALIVGFNVRPAGKAKKLAQAEQVKIKHFSIIYEAIDQVRDAMEELLPATKVERELGKAEVRAIFRISKFGPIAGCMIVGGIVRRNAHARLNRGGEIIWTGKVASLRRFKDDAKEVREGMECGIGLEGFTNYMENDIIEVFEIEEIKTKL